MWCSQQLQFREQQVLSNKALTQELFVNITVARAGSIHTCEHKVGPHIYTLTTVVHSNSYKVAEDKQQTTKGILGPKGDAFGSQDPLFGPQECSVAGSSS